MGPGNGHGTIIVIEDDRHISDLVNLYLRNAGFRVLQAADAARGLEFVANEHPALVVLDIGLPGQMDGLEVCRELRRTTEVPVIFVTARDEEVDRILGLELGADDYLTKPFSPRELVARVKAVLRRSSPPASAQPIELGELVIDPARREVRRAGKPLRLTTLEFDLLWFLATNPNRVFERGELMSNVWGYTSELDTGTVTVHMRRLRAKIEDDPSRPRHLETVWGSGYRLTP